MISAFRLSLFLLFQSTLPAGGATHELGHAILHPNLFQSTLPAGGATGIGVQDSSGDVNFNPRSPRGERPHRTPRGPPRRSQFQSTLPAGGATGCTSCSPLLYKRFQSTLPAGGATILYISLGDFATYFNPRSPRGERLYLRKSRADDPDISIHAPRGGSDFAAYIGWGWTA